MPLPFRTTFESLKEHFWQERAVPLREFSMAELSGLRIDPDNPDFTADVLREMAVEFHSKDAHELLEKYRNDLKLAVRSKSDETTGKKGGGGFSFLKLFGASGGYEGSKRSLDEHASEEERLLDTMRQIKDNVEQSVRFEKKGEFYVAKDIALYDMLSASLNDDRVLSEEVVVDQRASRADPYKRYTGHDLWLPSIDDLKWDPLFWNLLSH